MTEEKTITRRAALTITGAGATAVALAACAPASDSAATKPGTAAPTAAPTTTAPAPDAAATDAPAASGTEVAKIAAIPVGGSIDAMLGDAPIVLAQPEAGTVVGFSAICTHQGCVVAAAKTEYDCPCHQSRFDAATGEPFAGSKALTGLAKLTVTVSGDAVLASA